MEGNGNSEGRGVQKKAICEGLSGGCYDGLLSLSSSLFFPGAPTKIDEQAISYFTVNWCFKAKIIVFIDDL